MPPGAFRHRRVKLPAGRRTRGARRKPARPGARHTASACGGCGARSGLPRGTRPATPEKARADGGRPARGRRRTLLATCTSCGHYHVAEPQGGEEHFAEGADINDASAGVEPLQGGERASGIAEFAVVVVLGDPRAAPPGPRQQRHAARQRHGDAQGILVRGRDVGHPRLRGCQFALRHREPFGIHRNRHAADARPPSRRRARRSSRDPPPRRCHRGRAGRGPPGRAPAASRKSRSPAPSGS